jgi:hypothetical protein
MGGFTHDDGYVQGVTPMHRVDAPRILVNFFDTVLAKNQSFL